MTFISLSLRGQETVRKQRALKLYHYLFLLFWVMKPFYFAASGEMQVSDFVFIAAFIAWIFQRKSRIAIEEIDFPFLGFVVCTFVINGIYYLIHARMQFIMSTLYFVYNLMVILFFRSTRDNKPFLKALMWASFSNLIIQLGILLLGMGSYFVANVRFMGTFNDPNQYSFSMFTSFLMVYLLSAYLKDQDGKPRKLMQFVAYVLAFYFIFEGSSTGMLLGLTAFSVALAAILLFSSRSPGFVFLQILGVMLAAAVLIFVLFSVFSSDNLEVAGSSDNFLMVRLNEKINKFDDKGIIALVEERGIDKAINHPHYLLYGSGEGYHARFPENDYEIHSTFVAILVSYGILPFLILFKWLRNNLKNIAVPLIPVYIGLLLESFTLAHQRQPVFWILIVLAGLQFNHKRMKARPLQLSL